MNKRNFLDEILARRRKQVALDRANCDLEAFHRQALHAREGKPPHRLRTALANSGSVQIIGEFKRASPSRGVIRKDADVTETVALYESAGVCAVSVLTEPEFFRGSLDDLRQARAATELPILRKDFIIDNIQIDEAARAGADAILLIAAALDDTDLTRLRTLAEDEFGLDALVEVHTAEEMGRAANCGAKLIGVNNRNLQTFETSLETSEKLSSLAPEGVTLVSESGICSAADIKRLTDCGYNGFLIGERLMRAEDPVALIRSLRGLDIEEQCRA
ncbi:MAG: indole-3-glycerol phosphate synthase TrpC [Verrucomicrobiota bacterium]